MANFFSLTGGTDWLLKRAFKFLLKRNLGCLLRNEARSAGAFSCAPCAKLCRNWRRTMFDHTRYLFNMLCPMATFFLAWPTHWRNVRACLAKASTERQCQEIVMHKQHNEQVWAPS